MSSVVSSEYSVVPERVGVGTQLSQITAPSELIRKVAGQLVLRKVKRLQPIAFPDVLRDLKSREGG